jgi:ribose transport system permease protein
MEENIKTQKGLKSINMTKIVPFLGLIFVVVLFTVLTKGELLNPNNTVTLFNSLFSTGLGVVGVFFVMAQGNIDFSIGSIIALSGSLCAMAYNNISPVLIVPVALLTGTAIGAINGFLVAKVKVPAFIATLSMSFIIRGIATVVLGGVYGIPFEANAFDSMFVKVPVLIITFVIGYIIFEYTKFGKHSRAIGSLPEAARQNGIEVIKTRWMAFIISGFMSGLIGFFSVVRSCTITPQSGTGHEFNVLIALLVGGMSMTGGWTTKFRSVIIGCLFITFLALGMSLIGLDVYKQQLVKGIIFIISVLITEQTGRN